MGSANYGLVCQSIVSLGPSFVTIFVPLRTPLLQKKKKKKEKE